MDLTSGCPFWPLKDGQPAAYGPLRDNVECDVVVIGGGVSGAITGHALTAAGITTVVVDKRDVATGSTAGSTSLLQYEPDMPLHQLARLRGEEVATRCYRLCRATLDEIGRLARACGAGGHFSRRESLMLASRARDMAGLARECEIRRRHGFDVELWDRKTLEGQSSLRHAGALLSRDAAVVDAYAFTHGVLVRAAKRGLRIFERTTITRFEAGRTGVVLRTDRGFKIRARKVVIAAGYEAQGFFERKWGTLHSTYAMVTLPVESFPGWPGDRLLWETSRPYVYVRRTRDGRVMIGGYDEPFRDPGKRDALLPAKVTALTRKLRDFFPKLECETAYCWTGTFAETPDSLPYIGASPEHRHTYVVLGYGGNGIIFSAIAGKIIRDIILGEKNEDADLFRFDR